MLLSTKILKTIIILVPYSKPAKNTLLTAPKLSGSLAPVMAPLAAISPEAPPNKKS